MNEKLENCMELKEQKKKTIIGGSRKGIPKSSVQIRKKENRYSFFKAPYLE